MNNCKNCLNPIGYYALTGLCGACARKLHNALSGEEYEQLEVEDHYGEESESHRRGDKRYEEPFEDDGAYADDFDDDIMHETTRKDYEDNDDRS